ncbi:MAG: hypothetical protein AABY32_04725 [Nanoarchaeota archaeon]
MSSKKYSFGSIICHETEYEPVKVIRITGVSSVGPNFTNEIDEQLWSKHWHNKSANLKVNYIHTQDRFDKDNKEFGSWSQQEIDEFTKNIISLTESYNESARKYNRTIVAPFIKEREGLLNKIFLG